MLAITNRINLSSHGARPVILSFLLLSGACGLIYEIVWTKMLALTIGNTVYSITAVLTSFMAGLALRGFLAGRFWCWAWQRCFSSSAPPSTPGESGISP